MPVPMAAIVNAMKRSWPGLAPSVSAASGLTAATRIVRPSAVVRNHAWKTRLRLASAIARIEIQLRPANTTVVSAGTGRAMPLMPLVYVAEGDEHLGKNQRRAERDEAEIETLNPQGRRGEQQAHRDRGSPAR